jgi:hypothetical protein
LLILATAAFNDVGSRNGYVLTGLFIPKAS